MNLADRSRLLNILHDFIYRQIVAGLRETYQSEIREMKFVDFKTYK